jgi:hypothetical protein
MIVADWETEEDNPVEQKYRKMAHNVIRGLVRRTLRFYIHSAHTVVYLCVYTYVLHMLSL